MPSFSSAVRIAAAILTISTFPASVFAQTRAHKPTSADSMSEMPQVLTAP